jgi:hypothetical protein
MSTNSGGADAPAADAAPSDNRAQAGQQGSNRRGRRNRSNNRTHSRHEIFKGKCEDLKGAIYDVNTSSTDTFAKTNKEVAEYVARAIPGAGEYRTAMINMSLPALDPPPHLTPGANGAIDPFDVEIWKDEHRRYTKKQEKHEEIESQVFPIVLGQCHPSLRERMQADDNWMEIDEGNNVIQLLQLIQNCEAQGQTCRDPTQAMMEAQSNLMNFKQSQNMSNTEYFEVFQAKLETADLLHAAIGEQAGRVVIELEEIAVDPDVPTNEDCEQARTAAKDKFLARLLLLNADKKRYRELIHDIENNHTRNIGGYPDTPMAAFDILVNYKPSRSRHVADEGGLSFYTDDQDEDDSTQPPQQCGTPGDWHPPAGGRGRGRSPGRGGCSGGRGRGRISGRGQGGQREVGSAPGKDNSHQQEAKSDAGNAQYLLDNLDDNVNYYSYVHPAVDHLVATSSTQERLHFKVRSSSTAVPPLTFSQTRDSSMTCTGYQRV